MPIRREQLPKKTDDHRFNHFPLVEAATALVNRAMARWLRKD